MQNFTWSFQTSGDQTSKIQNSVYYCDLPGEPRLHCSFVNSLKSGSKCLFWVSFLELANYFLMLDKNFNIPIFRWYIHGFIGLGPVIINPRENRDWNQWFVPLKSNNQKSNHFSEIKGHSEDSTFQVFPFLWPTALSYIYIF